MKNILIYTGPSCNFCDAAKRLLERNKLKFNEIDVSSGEKIRDEMKELLLKRLVSRKNRVTATDEFVLKDRDYSKEDDIMIGVW